MWAVDRFIDVMVDCGRSTLLKQTCAAQETQESTCQSQNFSSNNFRDLSVRTDGRTDGHG